jgi:hypothetical protein
MRDAILQPDRRRPHAASDLGVSRRDSADPGADAASKPFCQRPMTVDENPCSPSGAFIVAPPQPV